MDYLLLVQSCHIYIMAEFQQLTSMEYLLSDSHSFGTLYELLYNPPKGYDVDSVIASFSDEVTQRT